MFRIVHTSDWHLGQRFHDQDRNQEHQAFLDWLLELLRDEGAGALIVSGDIFDMANPSIAAMRLLFNFLYQASRLDHMTILLIGGNHDSAGRLDAPSPLLKGLNVHFLGGLPPDPADCLIPLRDPKGHVRARVAAVPYLRPADLPPANAGESLDEASQRFIRSVTQRYSEVLAAAREVRGPEEALLVAGHLYVAKGRTVDGERPVQMVAGYQQAVPASIFTAEPTYVALGHLHSAQMVEGPTTICYSGSPLPLSFSQVGQAPTIRVVELDQAGRLADLREVAVPLSVPLYDLTGPWEEVQSSLHSIIARTGPSSRAWVRASVRLDALRPHLREEVNALVEGTGVRVVSLICLLPGEGQPGDSDQDDLQEITHQEVFRRCYRRLYPSDPPEELKAAFAELIEALLSKENDPEEEEDHWTRELQAAFTGLDNILLGTAHEAHH